MGALLCVLNVPVLAVDLELTYVEVLGKTNHLYVVASLFRSQTPLHIVRRDNVMEGGNDPESVALRAYYERMMLGQPARAAELLFETDGSRQRFLDGLKELPARYEGYRALADVVIAEQYGWGPFEIEITAMTGTDGRRQNWREALVCARTCFISNAIDRPDDGFKLYSQIRRQVGMSKRSQAELKRFFGGAARASVLPLVDAAQYRGTRQYPLEVAAQLDLPAKPLEIALPIASGQRMVLNGVDFTHLAMLLSDLKQIDLKPTGVDARRAGDAIERAASASVAGRVEPNTLDTGLHFVSAFKPSGRIIDESYQPIAAAQRVNRWRSIKVIGFMTIEQDSAVFYQPTQERLADAAPDAPLLVEPVQVAVMRRQASDEWRVLLGGAGSRLQVVHSDPIAQVVTRKYGAQVTFLYEPSQ